MHFKSRGNRISLYRSHWIPKSDDVPHGYTHQRFVGSIEADAVDISPALRQLLTPDELSQLEQRVLLPAAAAREAAASAAARREQDPVWRIREATRLIDEASARSKARPVSNYLAAELRRSASALILTTPHTAQPLTKSDPLNDALVAIKAAAQAVERGQYGRAPEAGFRKTPVFQRWTEILAAVDGAHGSLLRALQNAGFASRRSS